MVFESSEKNESRKVGMESALFDILYVLGIENSTKSMDWMKCKTSNFVKTCHSVVSVLRGARIECRGPWRV